VRSSSASGTFLLRQRLWKVSAEINNISVVYSDYQVSRRILNVSKGRIVSLLEATAPARQRPCGRSPGSQAGKRQGDGGNILYDGRPIDNLPPEEITRMGIIQVLEGRQPFKYLTVEENLRVGTATHPWKPYRKDLERVYDYFPSLVKRRKSLAGFCSGGELQMLVMGRALMAHPSLLLLDDSVAGARAAGRAGDLPHQSSESTGKEARPSFWWSKCPVWLCRSPITAM